MLVVMLDQLVEVVNEAMNGGAGAPSFVRDDACRPTGRREEYGRYVPLFQPCGHMPNQKRLSCPRVALQNHAAISAMHKLLQAKKCVLLIICKYHWHNVDRTHSLGVMQ